MKIWSISLASVLYSMLMLTEMTIFFNGLPYFLMFILKQDTKLERNQKNSTSWTAIGLQNLALRFN